MKREPLIGWRHIGIRADIVDPESRSFEISFSSEYPVRTWWGTEILDHGADSVDLSRLNDGGAVLLEHDRRQHAGVIERAWIADDRVGRSLVRLGTHAVGEEARLMVSEGVKRHVSVGYFIHRLVLEEENQDTGEAIFRAMSWEPFENSLVAVPADPSVGVGRELRSFDVEVIKPIPRTVIDMKRKTDNDTGDDDVDRDDTDTGASTGTRSEDNGTKRDQFNLIDRDLETRQIADDAADKAVKADRHRQRQIRAAMTMWRRNPKLQSLGEQAINEGWDLATFQERATPLVESAGALPDEGTPETELGMSSREVQRFSIVRAIDAQVQARTGGGNWRKLAPFEAECSDEVAERLDREAQGFYVPHDVQRSGAWFDPYRLALHRRTAGLARMPAMFRAPPMDTTENVDLVPTEHLAANYIEALRATAILFGLGARQLTGLVGNVDIPRTDTPASFTWIAEDADSVDTELVTGTVAMTPHTVSGSVPITRRLRKQSSPDVELLVREDLILGAALALDLAGLEGSGAGAEPEGVGTIAGVATVAIATPGAPTWPEAVQFETEVAEANGLRGSLAYVTTAAVRGSMKTTPKDAGSGMFVSDGGECNGYPHVISTQLPTNRVFFGNWTEVMFGLWGVLDIRVDTATEAAKDRTTIRAFQDTDVGIRHAESFAKDTV